ncbi:type II toxin-antitoxin system VapC family toxin [Staphylothermus hellenicus]|uniref:PilT protein domain protein n=1 Tax=Staphylothermus hellenicus (strain DSM 12710 / JCM 10830 / BK20S6-10-b1 / P8) TaxID=591019 RepID=D7D803_STAHD|nr:type II toxin-antitoxin system VapC family toxin [Staphylothermus hellenicus]ADI31899.1 PilT protein domain protein [Staphylothermus hellenicus DSM 12710]
MEGEKVVVDASVIVKWFVEEKYSREAWLLRDAYVDGLIDINAPSLLPYEVLNALKYSGAFGEDELKKIGEALDDFQFTLYDLKGELSMKSIEIAMRKGITVYDASYVALAMMLNTKLYTADEELIRKTSDLGLVKHISQFRI